MIQDDEAPKCQYKVKGRPCGAPATTALYIGSEGKLELYLCKDHRPSVEEVHV